MNERRIKKILFFALSAIPPIIFAALGAPRALFAAGATSAAFLKLGVGARPVAMGSAFTGIADDANAAVWNPAGLVNAAEKEFSFMHLEHFQNIKYDSLCYVRNRGKTALGFGFGYLASDAIARTFIDDDIYAGWRAGGSYGFENKTLFFSAARTLARDKSAGVLFRWLSETIEDHAASGVSMDAGYLWLVSENISLGFAAQNIGSTMRFISSDESLPLVFRAGAGYLASSGRFKAGLDTVFSSDYQPSVNLGCEYIAAGVLSLRAGWRFKDIFRDDYLDDISGLSLGAGFAFYGYTLDYAFAPYGDLGYSHRISLGGKFQ